MVFIYDKHLHFCCGILLQEKINMDTAEHLKNLVVISDNKVSNTCAYFILFAILNVNFAFAYYRSTKLWIIYLFGKKFVLSCCFSPFPYFT